MRNRRTRIFLAVLFVVALALRLGFCAQKTGLGTPLERDYREYIALGQRLLAYGTVVSPLILTETDQTPSALLPPGYTALVAVTYAVLGIESFSSHLALHIVNALATSLCVLVVFRATRLMAGGWAPWIAAGLVAVNPTLLGFTHLIWETNLLALAVALTIWLGASLATRRPSSVGWLGFGLWLGLLAMLNPALTAAYPFLVLWPVVKQHGWRPPAVARSVGLTVVGWAIAVAPWTVRNYVHFGELIYIRGGFMEELWLGVCPEADTNLGTAFTSQFPLLNEDAQRHVAAVGERAYIEECGRRATEAIAADPWRWCRLVMRRTADYWLGTLFSLASADGLPKNLQRLLLTMFMFGEVFVIVVSLAVRGPVRAEMRWLLATVLSFSIVFCLTHVQVRFRAPIEPIMAVLVAVLASGAYAGWREGRASRSSHRAPRRMV